MHLFACFIPILILTYIMLVSLVFPLFIFFAVWPVMCFAAITLITGFTCSTFFVARFTLHSLNKVMDYVFIRRKLKLT